ncbi:hypothetical protein AVEN_98161-1 [Araneus ventricosus]|uniref:Uncharacterized protein n=1 Tax=Araneus ventricosus TaxID=182803 RepID=A0A4Y2LGL5_ARAVE|nr:hypothetical protein AVEN_98161-1 [Araneus ventricosus]
MQKSVSAVAVLQDRKQSTPECAVLPAATSKILFWESLLANRLNAWLQSRRSAAPKLQFLLRQGKRIRMHKENGRTPSLLSKDPPAPNRPDFRQYEGIARLLSTTISALSTIE